jgi:hypothetical protein
MLLRISSLTALLLALFLTLCPYAYAGFNEVLPDSQTLTQLEVRAQQANPRDQCFLYAELVHTMTEMAAKQLLDGDGDAASATLKKVEHYAQLIHLGLANDTKRLKNAEMLMHHTAYRLGDLVRVASSEDRPILNATLKHLDQVQTEILLQVFNH